MSPCSCTTSPRAATRIIRIAGASIARELGPRFGLTPAETETAAWLVEHHLPMSQFAQSRDLNDPKTIRDFAALVQSRERLKLLMLLTVADIRAVGPGRLDRLEGAAACARSISRPSPCSAAAIPA